jgi:hypothetical protein
METVNIHNLSIAELEEHSQKVKDLLIISKAREQTLDGDFLSEDEVYSKLLSK